jgi:hypothetical protein
LNGVISQKYEGAVLKIAIVDVVSAAPFFVKF